jgi:hypothetical protein
MKTSLYFKHSWVRTMGQQIIIFALKHSWVQLKALVRHIAISLEWVFNLLLHLLLLIPHHRCQLWGPLVFYTLFLFISYRFYLKSRERCLENSHEQICKNSLLKKRRISKKKLVKIVLVDFKQEIEKETKPGMWKDH